MEQTVHLLDVLFADGLPCRGLAKDGGRGEELSGVTKSRTLSNFAEHLHRLLVQLQTLDLGPDVNDLHQLLPRVGHGFDDEETVQQVDRDTVRGLHVSATDGGHATVGGEDNDGGESRLKSLVEECETLDIKHVHLVNEQHARHKLRHTVLDVFVDHLVDLPAELLGDLCLAWLHHRIEHRHRVLSTLGAGVGDVEVVEGDVLDDLLLLVHITLGHRHVLLRLQVEFRGKAVRASNAPHRTAAGLDVDHVTHLHALLLDALIDGCVELQLFRALARLQPNNDVRDGLPVPSKGVLNLLWGDLGDLALVHLLHLLDTQPDRTAEVLHKHLGLLNLGGEHFGPHHGAEGHLRAKFGGDAECQCSLPRPGRTRKEKCPAGHLLGLDHFDHDTGRFTRLELTNHTVLILLLRSTLVVQAQTLHVGVGVDTLLARGADHLLDLEVRHFELTPEGKGSNKGAQKSTET
eukprot:Hpha_TRINITY_DN14610_c2_g17::TRINITY_DN14610_c2_g17_i1::g.48399::m.48399